MKLKAAVKYQLWEARGSVLFFYGCVLALFTLLIVLAPNKDSISVGNIEWITAIFLFISGIVTFSVNFKLYMQNGLSRSLLSKSILLAFLLGCLIMVAADFLVQGLFLVLRVDTISSISLAYPSSGVVSRWFLHYCLLFFMSYVGYFIGAFYYRLNKHLTILFSILIPVLLIFTMAGFGITTISENVSPNELSFSLDGVIRFIGQSPIHLGVSLLALAGIFALLSHLLTRRANLK